MSLALLILAGLIAVVGIVLSQSGNRRLSRLLLPWGLVALALYQMLQPDMPPGYVLGSGLILACALASFVFTWKEAR